jgi:hypothetical protein
MAVILPRRIHRARVLAVCVIACASLAARAQSDAPLAAAAVAKTVLWGVAMPPPDLTRDLPRDVQPGLAEFRQREQMFRSALKAPPGATDVERALFDQRVAIERVLFCLYPRRDIARVAAAYASDADVSTEWEGLSEMPRHEAAFIDELLRDLQQKWLAPYLHLIAGHRKLCASQMDGAGSEAARRTLGEEGRRQIAHAGRAGQGLIRVAAEHLLSTNQCVER